jgi:hypothetical protein
LHWRGQTLLIFGFKAVAKKQMCLRRDSQNGFAASRVGKENFFKPPVYRNVILKEDGLLSGRQLEEKCFSLRGLVHGEKCHGGIVANVPQLKVSRWIGTASTPLPKC